MVASWLLVSRNVLYDLGPFFYLHIFNWISNDKHIRKLTVFFLLLLDSIDKSVQSTVVMQTRWILRRNWNNSSIFHGINIIIPFSVRVIKSFLHIDVITFILCESSTIRPNLRWFTKTRPFFFCVCKALSIEVVILSELNSGS